MREQMIDIDNPELFKKLHEHKLRPTEARRIILALLNEKNEHPNTEGIVKRLQEKGIPLSIATLYQNLDKLVEAGLLIRIKGPEGLMRFDANLAPHHHLVCNSCGKIVDVKLTKYSPSKKKPISFQTGNYLNDWQVESLKIEYQGTCPTCQK